MPLSKQILHANNMLHEQMILNHLDLGFTKDCLQTIGFYLYLGII